MKNSTKRKQYFQKRTEIFLETGVKVHVKYIEVYPESIGVVIPNLNGNELLALIGGEIEQSLGGKIIGKTIDNEGRFTEQIIIIMNDVTLYAYAKFELVQEDYVFLIRLIYIA